MVDKMISARCVKETNACQTHCRMCAPWMHVSDSTRLDSIAAGGALVIDEVSFCSASLLEHFEHRISNPREKAAAYYQIKYMSKNDMPVEASVHTSKDSH